MTVPAAPAADDQDTAGSADQALDPQSDRDTTDDGDLRAGHLSDFRSAIARAQGQMGAPE